MPNIGNALGNFLPTRAHRVAPDQTPPPNRAPLLSQNLSHGSNLAREMRLAVSSIGHTMGRALSSLENTMGRRFGDARASVAPMPAPSASVSSASASSASPSSAFVSVGNARDADRFAGYPIANIGKHRPISDSAFKQIADYDWQGLRRWDQAQLEQIGGRASRLLGPMEARSEASSRIQHFHAYYGEGKTTLDLGGLHLTSCPPIPDGVEHLDLSGNPLQHLPAQWPSQLKSLALTCTDDTVDNAMRLTNEIVQRGGSVTLFMT